MTSLRRPSQAIPSSKGASRGPSKLIPSPLSRLSHLGISNNDSSGPFEGSGSGSGSGSRRDARKSRVGDAIKRRMSMRYAPEQLNFNEPPPVPSLPPPGGGAGTIAEEDEEEVLPDDAGESKFGQFASSEFGAGGFGDGGFGRSPAIAGEETIRRRGAIDQAKEEEWDLDELGNEGFDVASFLKRTLTGADSEEVKRFKAALQRYKQQNSRELQRNVFKHYAEFVLISKEISTLENDMLELKELLGQWKDLPQLMGMDDTLAPVIDKSGNVERRRAARNSIADLQTLYKAQLTNLWSTVEGSQKYLPLVPGRHLVFETHNFLELNAATYKAKQSVSMFLLSDLLLIAGRRRTKTTASPDDKGSERGRMVAERCWILADLVVIDVKDSGDLTNALKIRRGKEVVIYRGSKAEDKKALLAAFRQVSQELSEKKRKDNEKEQERRRTMYHGAGDANGSGPSSVPTSPNVGLLSPRRLSTISMSMADSKDLRWIDEFGDELTMSIAMRDWDQAMDLVEKGHDLLKIAAPHPTALELLTLRLDHLRANLISSIAYDLSIVENRKNQVLRLVGLLHRLDRAELARDTFLKARHEVMLKRIRGIKPEGDISMYVSELSVVCFTVIRHTSDWYMSAFKENRMASGFVTWAKTQIEEFSDLFRRQVYAPNIDNGVAEECMKVTAAHNRKLLRDIGLDFTFLLSTLLHPDPTAAASSKTLHPTFQWTGVGETPAVATGYHMAIDHTPFTGFAETPAPDLHLPGVQAGYAYGYEDVPPARGTTQPLSINPKSPRKASMDPGVRSTTPASAGRGATPTPAPTRSASNRSFEKELSVTRSRSPDSPAPPPRSSRRAPSFGRQSSREEEDDDLR